MVLCRILPNPLKAESQSKKESIHFIEREKQWEIVDGRWATMPSFPPQWGVSISLLHLLSHLHFQKRSDTIQISYNSTSSWQKMRWINMKTMPSAKLLALQVLYLTTTRDPSNLWHQSATFVYDGLFNFYTLHNRRDFDRLWNIVGDCGLCLDPDESSAENQLSSRARAANIKTNLGQTLPAMCENKNQITKFHIKVNELVKPRRCILRILKPSTLHKIKYTLENSIWTLTIWKHRHKRNVIRYNFFTILT